MAQLLATLRQVLDWCRSQIGVVERPAGSNRNPYGRLFGRDGEPWCGFYVAASYLQARTDLRSWCDNVGYTPNLLGDLRSVGWGVNIAHAQPGALVFFHSPGGRAGTNHVGVLESIDTRARTVTTIDGNTSPTSKGSQHNGGCVARKTRSWSTVTGVVQVPLAAEPQAAAIEILKAVQVAIFFARQHVLGPDRENPAQAVRILQEGLNRWADRFAAMVGAPNPPDLVVNGRWDAPTQAAVTELNRMTGQPALLEWAGEHTWAQLFP